jgi:hypothetical protein
MLFLSWGIADENIKNFIENYKGFEPNFGQIANFEGEPCNEILFFSKNDDLGIFLKENGLAFVIYKLEKENFILNYARIDIELMNSNIKKENIIYEDELPGYVNYYFPHCPQGVLFVKSYRKVKVKEIYPGIDWIFRYEDGRLHHEFEISKDARVENIKLKIKYADVEIKDGKKIIFSTPLGKIEDGEIKGYEGGDEISIFYKEENGLIGFDIKNWKREKKLIIDPPLALIWATYYGGSEPDFGFGIEADNSGNIFLTGRTYSLNFPTHNPGGNAYYQGCKEEYSDIFILKFDNCGVRLWATYYGGNGWEEGYSITTDDSGNIFLTGATSSTDFPTYDAGGGAYYQGVSGGGWDIFILKFNNFGIRLWATYYGGSDWDYGYFIKRDIQGNIFLTGVTWSFNFPTYNPGSNAYYQGFKAGYNDIFILKFNNNGVRKWATYYGGTGKDWGSSIEISHFGKVFLTGQTQSTDFPTINPGSGYYQGSNAGEWDAFILEFDTSGVRLWATYYGGIDWDCGYSIKQDNSENIFLTGATYSTNLPTYNPGGNAYYQGSIGGFHDAFILKFDKDRMMRWGTYYGGYDDEYPYSLIIDIHNNIFLTGKTHSLNFPTYNPGGGTYYQGFNAGKWDAFILKFNNSGIRLWATYYGGNDDDYGYSLIPDIYGNIFLTGTTYSTNIPLYNPGGNAYYQELNAGHCDAFILKFEKEIEVKENFQTQINFPYIYVSSFFDKFIKIKFVDSSRGLLKFILYDKMGRMILKEKKIENNGDGIYFLKIYLKNKEFNTFKLIKTK